MAKQIITIQVEAYNANNIRTDFESKQYLATIDDEKYHQMVKIPKSTTDKEINPTNTGAEYLLIFTNQPIKIKLNDVGNEQWLINNFYAISTGALDKVFVTNESADTDAEVIFYLANKV